MFSSNFNVPVNIAVKDIFLQPRTAADLDKLQRTHTLSSRYGIPKMGYDSVVSRHPGNEPFLWPPSRSIIPGPKFSVRFFKISQVSTERNVYILRRQPHVGKFLTSVMRKICNTERAARLKREATRRGSRLWPWSISLRSDLGKAESAQPTNTINYNMYVLSGVLR